MTDELDALSRLVDYHDHIAPPSVPVADDVQRGRQRVRRNRGILTGAVALGIAGVVLTASLITGGDLDTRPEPAFPSPSDTATDTAPDPGPENGPENGRITSAQKHLGAEASDYQWRAFDSASDTGLFVSDIPCDDCAEEVESLTVVAPAGPVSTLACPEALTCLPDETWLSYPATLGPGADEITVQSGDRTLQVIGYDGTVRRTFDLTATLDSPDDIRKLAWSPDGSRLAVATDATDIWLVDGDGDAQLAYSPGSGRIWSLGGWSPDGQSLLVDQYVSQTAADVMVLHLPSEGSPAMREQTLYRSDRHFDWAGNVAWSPDGTRIAVRTKNSIVEISAEDGSVLARHQHRDGWLIWPRRDR